MTAVGTATTRLLYGIRSTWLLQIVLAGCVAAFTAFLMMRLDPLMTASVAVGAALLVVGIRYPLVPLGLFLALIPLEDAIDLAGIGTLSRWSGILFAVAYAVPRIGRLNPRALPLAAWGYLGWALLSFTWTLDPASADFGLQTLTQLVVVAYLVADLVIHRPSAIRPLLWAYSATAGLTAFIGIATQLTQGTGEEVRVAALGGQNPAQFATLLLPALIFTLDELLHGRWRIASGAVAFLCTVGILLSGTRSVWLAAGVVVVMLLLPRLGRRQLLAAAAAVAVMLIGAFQFPGASELVADRAGTAASTGGAGRTDIWAVGLHVIGSSPIIGVGYSGFPEAFISFARSSGFDPDVLNATAPHNVLVGNLSELGIIGVTLLGLFIVPLIIRPGWGPDGPLIQAILVALMVDALFIDILDNKKQAWVIIGMAAGLAYLADQARRARSRDAPGSPETRDEPAERAGRGAADPAGLRPSAGATA